MRVADYLWSKARDTKKSALPVLSFPAGQKLGVSVDRLVKEGELQAKAMEIVAQETPSIAAVSFMDLSVESEAFGSQVRYSEDEVPTVIGHIVANQEEAEALKIPPVGAARTGVFVEAIARAKARITDRPVLAGVTGPFTLTGRLFDVNAIMLLCYDDPRPVHTVLKKVNQFLIDYSKALKAAGADGVFIAEPLAGLLSPDMDAEFSTPYIKHLVEALQEEEFALLYHNCGPSVIRMLPQIFSTGATAYHFGNALDMREVMQKAPGDKLCMGNIDPAGQFANGTVQSIKEETLALLHDLKERQNFIISSGCDIPPHASWQNIEAFFDALEEFNSSLT